MHPAKEHSCVFVTAPNITVARKLAAAALNERLVACANLLPKIESHYWWKGKLEKGAEVLILFKTTAARVEALEKLILAHHPYETAEVIALPLTEGTPAYLSWIEESVAGPY